MNFKVGMLIDFNPLKRKVNGDCFTFGQLVGITNKCYIIYDFRFAAESKIFKTSLKGWYDEGTVKIYE
jgi:hypothetical protein